MSDENYAHDGEHAVARELRSIRIAIEKHSKNTGKWLAIIAEAAVSQSDSPELKKLVDEIKSSTDELESTVAANQPEQT